MIYCAFLSLDINIPKLCNTKQCLLILYFNGIKQLRKLVGNGVMLITTKQGDLGKFLVAMEQGLVIWTK
ncbi:Uncharacterised protein [Sphingobacterium multivorum]|nr:Uncharacterised protein [Sphingobacterium multivorum]